MKHRIGVFLGLAGLVATCLMLAGCSDAFAWNNDQDAGQINGYRATEYGIQNTYGHQSPDSTDGNTSQTPIGNA